MKIKLTTIQEIREFVEIISRFPVPVDAGEGRYIVDAKSIMGLFSIDLSRPVELTFRGNVGEEWLSQLMIYQAEKVKI